jgi:hypothetical protein
MSQRFSSCEADAALAAGVVVYRNSDNEFVVATDVDVAPEGIADTNAAAAGVPVRAVWFGDAQGIAGEAVTAADYNKRLCATTGGKLILFDVTDYTPDEVVWTVGRVRGIASGDGVPLAVFVDPQMIALVAGPEGPAGPPGE